MTATVAMVSCIDSMAKAVWSMLNCWFYKLPSCESYIFFFLRMFKAFCWSCFFFIPLAVSISFFIAIS